MISLAVILSLFIHGKQDDFDTGCMLSIAVIDMHILYGVNYFIGG